MKTNISEHYDSLEKRRLEQVANQEAEAKKLKAEVETKIAQEKELRTEKSKKEKLKEQVVLEGVDASKLDARISELDAQIAKTAQIIVELRGRLATQPEPPKSIAERTKKLTSVLKSCCGCVEAVRVEDVNECWAHLPIALGDLDEAGRLQSCMISLGSGHVREVKITTNRPRYAKKFRPEALQWVPTTGGKAGEYVWQSHMYERERFPDSPQIYAFLDSHDQLILSRTKFSWSETQRKEVYSYGRQYEEVRVEVEDDFSDTASGLIGQFDHILTEAGGTVDLGKSYDDNVLMRHLRDYVISETVEKPLFEPTVEEIPSADIYKAIKRDWDKISSCAWSGQVRDNMALLKYYLEDGEKARFWVEGFKNHYGFRLRTRDHSWIKGFIYAGSVSNEKSGSATLRIHHAPSGAGLWVASLGDMWLAVKEREQRR